MILGEVATFCWAHDCAQYREAQQTHTHEKK